MQHLITHHEHSRPEVLRSRQVYGLFYGFAVAFAFAAWTWGLDSFQLSQANAIQPWTKFVIGLLACLPIGGIAGWLAMKVERGWFSAVVWLVAAVFFAWMSVGIPFLYAPQWIISTSNLPISFQPVLYEYLFLRAGVAFAWVAIFVTLCGLIELPMGESAVFSTSFFGKIGPLIVCAALMFISGYMVDSLNNQPFRDPLQTVDSTVQFKVDHFGEKIDPKTSRDLHLAGLRTVEDVLLQPRKWVIGEYDRELGLIHVLGKFGDDWIDCYTVYGQLASCKKIEP